MYSAFARALITPAANAPAAGGRLHWALQFTLLDLLLRPIGSWYIRPVILTLACLGLVSNRVRCVPAVFAALALLAAFRIYDDWPLADNHAYLLAYWLFAAAIALTTESAEDALASSARLLLILVFGLAVLWKAVLTPDFLDGTFFRVTLQTDGRFDGLARTVGGLSAEQLAANRAYLTNPLPEGVIPVDPPEYAEPEAFRRLVWFLTWSTLAIESAVALLFALPHKGRVATAAHVSLIVFCVSTYAIAPVAGFGWLLIAMGIALLDSGSRLRWAYGACFFLLLFYREDGWREFVFSGIGVMGGCR